MKRALIFTMHYWPQQTSVGPFTTDLSDHLAQKGWKVTVLTTFPHYPRWEVDEAYRGRFFQREKRGDIDIVRVWVYVPPRPQSGTTKTWRRIAYDSTLAAAGLPAALMLPRQDVIIAVCPPLQTGLAAMALKSLWGAPIIYWVQDIVPDAAVSTGMMREGLALKVGRKLERIVYRGVDTIVNVSHGFEMNLKSKGVPSDKMIFLPNWANLMPFANGLHGSWARQQQGFAEDDFVVVHAGNVGAKQALENVIRAMKLLEAHTDIHLVIVGEGNSLDTVKQEAARLQTRQVRFLPTTETVDEYIALLRAADALIINQAKDVKDSLIPSKLLTYLPSERPVLAAVHAESEAARFVEQSASGVVIEPEAPEKLAQAIVNLRRVPDVRMQMGMAGSQFIRQNYERSMLLQRFEAVLNQPSVAGTGRYEEVAM